ncbi:MAG: LamB/YcsF family protein [Actinomycetota bacterium]|nr:LamB/YcsF family protein [Actinomycetota bacterium]
MDINADLGESFGSWRLGDDANMLALITSANVACGFHAGDPTTLLRTCEAAVAAGVVIGAQVGYADLRGFGRRFVDVAPDDMVADVVYQIGALDGLARTVGGRVAYVKPHGALYTAVVRHHAQAGAVVEAVRSYDPTLPLLGLPDSVLLAAAATAGLPVVQEGFADRAYADDGTLVPRDQPGALLTDEATVAAQAVRLAPGVDSICVHGDTPGAVALARAVREALSKAEIELRAFAGGG